MTLPSLRAHELMDSALSRPMSERAAFLDGACSENVTLREEVESLLVQRGASLSLTPGARIGHYEILRPLGAGGMGEVFLALDTRLGRQVALKFLPLHLICSDSTRRRFAQEARIAATLNHPHIVTILDVALDGDDKTLDFIAMEYVEGQPLSGLMQGHPLPLPQALSLAEQVATALQAAHEKGIVHRDLKPSNIMLTAKGEAKVLDFGLAKFTAEDSSASSEPDAQLLTTVGVVLGTVPYMSPEQALGQPVDGRSDLFSFGSVLYEMITGQRPFRGTTATETLDHILHQAPGNLAAFNPQATPELERVVAKCLEKDRNQRYPSAQELVLDLRHLIQRSGKDADTVRLSKGDARASLPDGNPELRANQALFTRRPWLLGGAVATLALAGSGLYYARTPRGGVSAVAPIDSLAVLPLANSDGDPDKDYLADGVTDSLIDRLSLIPNLKVMSRNSVMGFKGKSVDARQAAKALGVRAVMMGTLRHVDGQVVIHMELINGSDGSLISSRRYVRDASGVLTMQSEIAQDVVGNLRGKLSGEDQQRLAKQPTTSVEAYQLYLKGRFLGNRFSPEDGKKAQDSYRQAIVKDPSFALAYAGLAETYLVAGIYFDPPNEAFPKAKTFAEKAIALDPGLSDAHINLGLVHLMYEWDWAGAHREMDTQAGTSPKALETFSCTAHLLQSSGKGHEAEAAIRGALASDPLSVPLNTEFGCNTYYERQYNGAIQKYRDALELDPHNLIAYWGLGRAYGQKQMYAEALAELEKAVPKEAQRPPIILAEMGYVFGASGRTAEARQIIHDLESLGQKAFVDPFFIAVIYLGMGDKDQAFVWLEKAFKIRSAFMVSIQGEPKFDPIRADPRFKDLIRRIGFPS